MDWRRTEEAGAKSLGASEKLIVRRKGSCYEIRADADERSIAQADTGSADICNGSL